MKIMNLGWGDEYKERDGISWDSEYVYVIDIDNKIMYKYACGICDPHEDNMLALKTDDDNLEHTYDYNVDSKLISLDASKNHWVDKFIQSHTNDVKNILNDAIMCGYIDGYNTVLQAYKNIFGLDENYWKLVKYLESKGS